MKASLFKHYQKQAAQEIETELKNFSNNWHATITEQFPLIKNEHELFTASFFGGKMLRGTLVKLGFELTGAKATKAIIRPAVAFEIAHAALLMHDDIIDKSPMRRGRPTLHTQIGEEHYGISQTICLGDIGLIQATKLITESDFPIEKKTQALTTFLQIMTETMIGEMLDVASPHQKQRTENNVLQIHRMKTAQYTIIGPLTIGAILGDASLQLLQKIKHFGENLGIAYQIQDDILGIFGDEKTIGKSITSDIEENKSTLLLTYSLDNATEKQKTILKKYYGKKDITTEEQETIKIVFQDTGALAYSQEKISEYTIIAKQTISVLSKDKKMQMLLTQLTNSLLQREK